MPLSLSLKRPIAGFVEEVREVLPAGIRGELLPCRPSLEERICRSPRYVEALRLSGPAKSVVGHELT